MSVINKKECKAAGVDSRAVESILDKMAEMMIRVDNFGMAITIDEFGSICLVDCNGVLLGVKTWCAEEKHGNNL